MIGNTQPQSCPQCGLINPPGALACDCGYSFDSKRALEQTLSRQVNAVVCPWIRYWARVFDMLLFSVITGLVLGILFPRFFETTSSPGSDLWFSLLVMLLWVFVDALLISKFGKTPGKWLFKVNVAAAVGGRLPFRKALNRSFKVWWRGIGMGLPIVSLFTLVYAYRQLKKNSVTTWDRDEGCIVAHEKIGWARAFCAFACFGAVFSFIAAPTIWLNLLSERPQNGIYLILHVQTDEALNNEVMQDAYRISQELHNRSIQFGTVTKGTGYRIEIVGADNAQADEVRGFLEKSYNQKYSIQSNGLDQVKGYTLSLLSAHMDESRKSTTEQTVNVIRSRLAALGIRKKNFEVYSRVGKDMRDQIIVEMYGIDKPERVKGLIENTAKLGLHLVKEINGGPFPSVESAIQANGGRILDQYSTLPYREDRGGASELSYLIVDKLPVITGKDVKTARRTIDYNGNPAVSFFLTSDSAELFSHVTEQNVGKRLAIVFDNVVSSAPVINSRIGNEGIIEGHFTVQQAEDLALLLRSGALPASMKIIDEGDIGNSKKNSRSETI
jgi:protein-export membrane protein SecD